MVDDARTAAIARVERDHGGKVSSRTISADGEAGAHPDPSNEIDFQDHAIPSTGSWDWNCAGGVEQSRAVGGTCFWFGATCNESLTCCYLGAGAWKPIGGNPNPTVVCGQHAWMEFCGPDMSEGYHCADDQLVHLLCR